MSTASSTACFLLFLKKPVFAVLEPRDGLFNHSRSLLFKLWVYRRPESAHSFFKTSKINTFRHSISWRSYLIGKTRPHLKLCAFLLRFWTVKYSAPVWYNSYHFLMFHAWKAYQYLGHFTHITARPLASEGESTKFVEKFVKEFVSLAGNLPGLIIIPAKVLRNSRAGP